MRSPRASKQLPIDWSKGRRGGARKNAGRKPRPENVARPRVAHRTRPAHAARHPVHVTLRVQRGIPSLRAERVKKVLERLLVDKQTRDFQAVHFSIQQDHLHLIVEARDGAALVRGLRRLTIAFALRMNRWVLRRTKGKVWGDRYHRHDLTTPTETKNALRYVLMNFQKHGLAPRSALRLDRFSSAARFEGWSGEMARLARALAERDREGRAPRGGGRSAAAFRPPAPRTWLLAAGFRRGRTGKGADNAG